MLQLEQGTATNGTAVWFAYGLDQLSARLLKEAFLPGVVSEEDRVMKHACVTGLFNHHGLSS